MLAKRIIPCLDVRNGRVVKGTNFEGLRDMADPVEMARFYNESGADELVGLGIDGARRVIEDEDLRIHRKDARDGYTSLLSAG